jgi:4a-hydroxytetrahydrobiopterin dehydratase
MKKKALKTKEIEKHLKNFSGWTVNKAETQMSKTFEFKNFVAALAFCAKVAVHAEVLTHHPDIELSYGKVKIKLSTHEIKGLSKLDFELAKRIDGLESK